MTPAPTDQTVGGTSEFTLISEITRGLPMPPAISVGPGDDAAVFLVDGSAVVSTDAMVENVHFRRAWSSAEDVGRKIVAVNVTDLEAMGATPVSLVIALAIPPDLPATWVREFSTGVRREADLAGIALVGGDTTRSRDITIAGTVIGQTEGRTPVTRGGARPGDVVAVVGRLGWAGAGLAALGRGFRSPRAAVDAQRCPAPPYGQGVVAAQAGATAMVDVSDGLLADLGHICELSGATIDLDSGELPVDDPVRTVAAATNTDPLTFVLSGGEDHALAATFPAGSVPPGWHAVGRVLAPGQTLAGVDATANAASVGASGAPRGAATGAAGDAGEPGQTPLVTVDGRAFDGPAGWDHFR